MSNNGSVEIGVKTIVILVVAIIVLGLAVGFVVSVFSKANQIPQMIDVASLGLGPTKDNPVVIFPQSLSVSSGGSTAVNLGIFNEGPANSIAVASTGGTIDCIQAGTTNTVGIVVQALCGPVAQDAAIGYKVIVFGKRYDAVVDPVTGHLGKTVDAPAGSYTCSIMPYVAVPNSCAPLTHGGPVQYIAQPLQFSLEVS